MKLLRLPIIIALLGACLAGLAKTDNVAEEVAWVVGDQPIWKSDIEETYQQYLYERIPIKGDPYCVIPEQMAIEKLYLHQADLDSIEIQAGMIAQRVEMQINNYINALGSREKVEEMLGKPINEIREQLTEMISNRSRVEQVQQKLVENVKASPSDVRRYYASLPEDSIPYVPLKVQVQILTLNPSIPREEIDDIKARLRDYSDRVNNGESEFSTLAILYSQDPGSASRGGELGFMSRSQMVPEYASVAFNLSDPKKVSKIVETEFGYHIIQLIEKRGDRINTRHILLQPKVADKDLLSAMSRLDSLRTEVLLPEKATFEDAVAVLSQDKDTRANRGIMVNQKDGTTSFEMADLPQEVAKTVNTMTPGEISAPFIMRDQKLNRDVVAIVKLTNRIDGHKANIGDDYQQLKTMYENAQSNEILRKWLDKKIAETYVRIEEKWRNCEFTQKGWIKERASESE